ncbi:MAG: DNA polymerase/3'-5' exonuclease PolX [bacterium]
MDNHQIARALEEIATLLELTDENAFKVRAYHNAARIVESLRGDIGELIERDELVKMKGIGRALADHIAEIGRTGKLAEYEKMRASVPPDVIQMLLIPGVGPKKVRYLWKKCGIKSIGELELLCQRHMLAGEPGFGAKTEEKILAGIGMLRRFSGSHRLDEALSAALDVHKGMRRWPEVIRSEIGGSIRRRKEVIHDVDILVATEKPEKVMERFVAMPQVQQVIQHGGTKSEVMLKSGIQCDLRAVSEEQYPFALHYFTGSKEHNVDMRGRAKSKGYKLNEYGLFKGAAKKSARCEDEAALFRMLGLDFIPPELRENMGETEAAAKHALPKLLETRDLRGVPHVHSNYTDGEGTIAEMADVARSLGYKYIVLADHSQAVRIAGGMKPADVRRQHKEIDALNRKLKGFRVIKGVEVDILADGTLDFDDKILSSFEFVIAAIHSHFGQPEDEMTQRIIRGISNPFVNVLAHPTGRLLLAREPYAVDLRLVIDAAVKQGVALEINSHPQRLDLDWRWCKYAKDKGARMIIDPDAHSADEIQYVEFGVWVARKGWLEKGDILNCLDADQLLARVNRRK